MRLTSANRWQRRHWPPDAMPRWCCEFVDSRLRRSPPDRASAVPYGQAGENAMRFPHLAHRSAAAHKLHSATATTKYEFDSGKSETISRLPALGPVARLTRDLGDDCLERWCSSTHRGTRHV